MQYIAIMINGISLALHGGEGRIEVRVVAGRHTAAVAASHGPVSRDWPDGHAPAEVRARPEADA